MANNKKIFTIEINGLEESVKSVGALEEKLQDLEKRVKNLGKGGGKKVLLEVDGDSEYNKLLAERQKLLKAVNQELGNTKKNVKEYKAETKDLVAMETKARNEMKGYTNDLRGLKQELKDSKEAIQGITLGSEAYMEMSQHIASLTEKLKELEAAQGTFSRNVGNYKSGAEYYNALDKAAEKATERTKFLNEEWKKLQDSVTQGRGLNVSDIAGKFSINELQSELQRVRDELNNTVNQEDYDKLKIYYDQLNNVTEEFKKLRGEVEKTGAKLKTEITRTINGQVYTWETLTSAVGELEDKLYQLAANGERNTDEFKSVAKAAAELKTELRQVDYEIDSMVESSAGINKMMSMTQGFTALAQGAVGIGQLFGMDSENATKGIQTMVALQGIVSALQQVQEQIQKGTAFGKTMEKWIGYMKMFSTWTIYSSKEFKNFRENLTAGFSTIEGIDTATSSWIDKSSKMITKSKKHFLEYIDIYKEIERLGGSVDKNLGGIAGLLKGLRDLEASGGSSPELNDLFNRVRSLQSEIIDLVSIFDGTNEKTKFLTSIEMFASNASLSFKRVGASILNAVKPANLLNTAFKGLNLTLKGLTVALKGFAKATIILAAFQVLVEIIGWITDIIGKTYQWAVGNDKLVNSLNKVETEIDLVNKALDRYNSKLSNLKNSGVIDDVDELALRYEKLQIEILKSAKALQDFVKARKDAKSLEEGTKDDDYTFFGKASDIEDIDDATERLKRFREVYFELQAAVEAGNDETGKRGKGFFNLDIFNWFTSSDAKSDFGEMQKQVIKDLQYQINNLDLSKGTDELKRFYELLQDPMYASAIANVDNLYPEEEWTQVLKKRLEQVQSMYEQITETAKESAEAELAYNEKLYEQRIQRLESENERRRRVRNNLTEAIKDEYEREVQALKNAKADEIEAARKQGAEMLKINADKVDVEKAVEEEISSINKKYNRLEMDMLKKHQEDKLKKIEESEWDITDILRRIRDNRLSAEEESLDKHLQEIENERKDALEDAAKEAREAAAEGHNLTELYNELALSINIKYDALVKKEKEQYYQDLLDMYEDYERAMQEVQMQYRANGLDDKSSDADIRYNQKLNGSNSSYDFNGNFIQEEKKFNQERLKIELEYLEDKKKLDEEYSKFDKDDASQQEQIRYEDALRKLKDFKEEGKATEEEYNALVEKEEELHMQQMSMIDSKYNNDLTTINNQYLNDRKSTISSSLVENASLYQEYANEVNDIMSNVGRDINAFGVLDYGKTKEQMEKAKEKVKEGVDAINSELANIERKRKSGEMSFIDYKQAKEELEQTKKTLEDQGKDITEGLDNLIKEVCSQWKGLVDSWVSQISSLLSTMNDTQMILIDNQLAEIEHQLEIQEEAYEKAEEAAEAHKDKMDSIEDELADARGSRRQFLIDTLAAQQAAYLEDVAAKEKAEQEKEKLEQKQKALEKKRAEQEKKAKVQQAVINTYMAVSNALAVQPWFVGLALSAVALALGLKNVSAIKSTPIYEDGGVIQGARHSQGGVKVLGGQAEVEGGEFITNRKSTAANLPLLTYINDKKREVTAEDLFNFFNNGTPTVKSKLTRKFASGGQLPTTDGSEVNRVMSVSDTNEGNKTYIVQVTDIINAQKNLEKVQVLSGLVNDK